MPTPTGQISLSDVNIELGKAAGALITMNDADVRGLAGVPSGVISMADLQGKSVPLPPEAATMSPGSGAQGWGYTSAQSGANPDFGNLSPRTFSRGDGNGTVIVDRITQGSAQNNTAFFLRQDGNGQPLPQFDTFFKIQMDQQTRSGTYLASDAVYTPNIAGTGSGAGLYFSRWTWANDNVIINNATAPFTWFPNAGS